MPTDRPFHAALLALPLLALPLMALTAAPSPALARDPAPVAAPIAAETLQRFASTGSGTFGTTRMAYDAVVEEFILPTPQGKPGASVYTMSYLARPSRGRAAADPARPVLFAFNGGPGSASLWLHLGLLGPERIDFDDPAHPQTTPPFHTTANADSPLDVADIVMIDPPGTGYSRILPDGNPALYYGVEADAQATVAVMEQWLRRHQRLNAPRYILSESYGTVRAAVVARLLAGGPTQTGRMNGLSLNGVILLGQALDMTRAGSPGDDRPALGLLPSLAATACHFGKGPAGCTPEGQAQAARDFIDAGYLAALHAGARLPAARRDAVAQGLAALTGIAPEAILARDLRLSGADFAALLLADGDRRLGLYDARFTLPRGGAGHDPVADDPAMGQYVPGFVAAWDSYARTRLGITLDWPYTAIAFREVNGAWDYGMGPGIPPQRNFATDLAAAMNRNPALRVLVGTGLYDLVTPLGTAEDTLAHAGVALDAVQFRTYRAGHMAYLGQESRRALAADLRAFLTGATRP